jgi:hypothetical protein
MLTGKLSLVFETQACIGSKGNETDKYYKKEKKKKGSTVRRETLEPRKQRRQCVYSERYILLCQPNDDW